MTDGVPVAIVTGGSGGMAPGAVRALRNAGYCVVLCARDPGRLNAAVASLSGGDAAAIESIACDVTDTASVAAMVQAVMLRFGRIDLLVNAAASSNPIGGAIETVDVAALMRDLDTKVGGYLRCIQAVVPPMKAAGRGRIVNIGGLTGRSSDTLSGLRNTAVAHLTKVMADQLGPHGITVNAVNPGITQTPHLDELIHDLAQKQDGNVEAVRQGFVADIPTGRICDPDEIGELIAFLAGSGGASINGESITIDGGYSRGIYL